MEREEIMDQPCHNKSCPCYDERRRDHCEIGPVVYCPDYQEQEETATMPNYVKYHY